MPGTRARRSPGSEEGFALIEVVVSAAVLILVVLGVMAALDAVTGTAGANKARTVAATLAERDQEELRSLRTADLNTLRSLIPPERTVTVGGVVYTIVSDAVWVSDTTGDDISCEVPEGDGSYIRITSTVTSPMTGARVKPVVMSSIVAPQPGSGTLSAMVNDADGRPVVNMPVQAIGPDTETKQTNDAGCAVFGSLDAGSYTVKVDQAGWVNQEGLQDVQQTVTVNAGILSTVEFVYDQAAWINPATIVRKTGATFQQDDGNGLMVVHSGLQTGFRSFPGAQSTAFNLQKLFPFPAAYKVYAGQCTGADPELYHDNFFEEYPGQSPKLERGTNFGSISVIEPATNIVVRRGTGSTPATRSGAIVYAYPTHASCAGQRILLGTTQTGGTLTRPGLPFGDYRICAQYTTSGQTYVRNGPTLQNRNPNGLTGSTYVDIPTTGGSSSATCPAT